MRLEYDVSGSNTTAMTTTLEFYNNDSQVIATRERSGFTAYVYYQLINWYVLINDQEEMEEDQPDKVGAYDLIYSTHGYRMDVGTIRLADGTDKDVVVVVGLNYVRTYDADDPNNLIEMDTYTDVTGEATSGRFTWPGTHNLRIVDHLSSPKAVLVDEGEQHLQCCQHYGITMGTAVARGGSYIGAVSPICENSSLTVTHPNPNISFGYNSATGVITADVGASACGHAVFQITDSNTCCTYATSHAVMVVTHGQWCQAGARSAWYLQCTTNQFSCTCEIYEGIYKKSWYTGWGMPGSCLGVGSIGVGCGCGYYGGNPANYCPCSSSTSIQYVNAGNPPHCDGCTAGAHVASVSISCWSSACSCESGKYDSQC
jgi:hypothetical protein